MLNTEQKKHQCPLHDCSKVVVIKLKKIKTCFTLASRSGSLFLISVCSGKQPMKLDSLRSQQKWPSTAGDFDCLQLATGSLQSHVAVNTRYTTGGAVCLHS